MERLQALLESINRELKAEVDPEYRERVRSRYNMNVDNFWGVRMPVIHKIAADAFKPYKGAPPDVWLAVCGHLLATRVFEHKMIAFRWAFLAKKSFEPHHLRIFQTWLDTWVDDWIDCDDLCCHVIGELFLKYPDLPPATVGWASSPNRWVRRGAAVSLVLPARRGLYHDLAFRVAEKLLLDEDDLVRKGYGWMLKEAGKTSPDEVFKFVSERKALMPRVSLRYAIEKLPEEMRHKAMQ